MGDETWNSLSEELKNKAKAELRDKAEESINKLRT
jgi:hypothetical protein